MRRYVREHLDRGYSNQAVKKVLIAHGYDEHYVECLLRKHSELSFVKKYAIVVVLLILIPTLLFNPSSMNEQQEKVTGYATIISSKDEGCCTSICQQTSKNECFGKFVGAKKCNELEDCNVGCCIDKEGYCLTNYLYGNCVSGNGISINKECSNLIFCRNITDKSYASRLYSINNKKGAGISNVKPYADYYRSSFNIRYYIYDKRGVLAVVAQIMDNGQLIDSLVLYDDGSHNDGAQNDNIYGNNWLSSKISSFDGFKKLDVDIVVKYEDGTQQSINKTQEFVILNNNKCLPMHMQRGIPKETHNIVFAAQNYENLSNGYLKFQDDVQSFISALFSVEKFSKNKENFNIYKIEQQLTYTNIHAIISIASSTCSPYAINKDLIIVLDNNEDYCISEGSGVLRVNPLVLFYKNMSNAELNDTLADLCAYILTPKKLSDEIINFAAIPNITVNTLENVTYNTSSINLSFGISSVNYPVNYSIFLEGFSVLESASNTEIDENIMLNLANGTNHLLIEATDKNGNLAFAQVLLNATLE